MPYWIPFLSNNLVTNALVTSLTGLSSFARFLNIARLSSKFSIESNSGILFGISGASVFLFSTAAATFLGFKIFCATLRPGNIGAVTSAPRPTVSAKTFGPTVDPLSFCFCSSFSINLSRPINFSVAVGVMFFKNSENILCL